MLYLNLTTIFILIVFSTLQFQQVYLVIRYKLEILIKIEIQTTFDASCLKEFILNLTMNETITYSCKRVTGSLMRPKFVFAYLLFCINHAFKTNNI